MKKKVFDISCPAHKSARQFTFFRTDYYRTLIFFLFVSLQGIGQNIPSFWADNPYNKGSRTKWLNEFSKHISLKDSLLSWDDYIIRQEFRFCSESEVVETWGRGQELPGIYFKEQLPVFFQRRLDFDRFDPGKGSFEWIFTGRDGGFTVAVTNDSIWLFQRFYDSFALNDLTGASLYSRRHPEKIWATSGIAYQGKLKSLEITVTHRLELILHINGIIAARQLFLHDVTAHQLRCVDKTADINGKMLLPKTKTCKVVVNPDRTYQEMLGFGGITIPTAYQSLSEQGKKQWWKMIREYNLLIHREYPIGQKLRRTMDNWDHPEDATVHYYGDNFPNSEISDFEYIKKIQDMGGTNIFEFWKLPLWVQTPTDIDIGLYVKSMVAYCKTAKEKTGRAPDIVGIQNETSQPDSIWYLMVLKLRAGLDEAGFKNIKIHMHNAPNLAKGIDAARSFTGDPQVWAVIDYSAVNMYDYQDYLANPDGYDHLMREFRELTADKPFLSTEISVNRSNLQIHSYKLAFQMGQLYHKNLTVSDASAIIYCWALLNNVQYSYNMSRSLFGVDELNGFIPAPFGFQDRVFGGFSRRVSKGMRRMDVQSGDSDLLSVAFISPNHTHRTLILMNRGTCPMELQIEGISGFTWEEKTSQYCRNDISRANGQVFIQPGEIITLTNVPLGGD
jgi:hypothetical protein